MGRGFRGGGRHGREWLELAEIWAELAGIWPAVGVEERGEGRREEARWGSIAWLGFEIRFCMWVRKLGLGGRFGPLNGDHLDGSCVLPWGDPWAVRICPLIG
jgi:hypothetical protein